MTKARTLFSIMKSLWLRTTRQPGWCDCIICRDEMLNLPDPLGFSQDAREFQKQLRKMPKAYKCKPCTPEEDHRDDNDETRCRNIPEDQHSTPTRKESHSNQALPQAPPPPAKTTKTVSFSVPLEQHHSPIERESAAPDSNEGYTYIHDSKMNENREKKTKCKENAKPLFRKKDLVRSRVSVPNRGTAKALMQVNVASTSSTERYDKDEQEPSYCDTDYSLYEAHPPKFPLAANRFYHDRDSMDSYGTITSQEILEAFAQASEELTLASLTNLGNPPPPCYDDSYLYTDLVYMSTLNATDV